MRFKQFIAESMSREELAKKLEVPLDAVLKMSPKELQTILKYIGKHDFKPNSAFDAKELEMGKKVELEHTENDIIALLIAKDHLTEYPFYYSELEKMEKSF